MRKLYIATAGRLKHPVLQTACGCQTEDTPVFTVQRIYAFHPESGLCAVFIDRLYPRGITKETFAAAEWLKDIAPGTALRRFYHENPEENFAAFAARYHEELSGGKARQAVSRLLELEKAHGEVRLLTAVRHPEQSHVSVLADFLGETFVYLDKTDGA